MRRFRGVLRDLASFASAIGYGLEQVRGLLGVVAVAPRQEEMSEARGCDDDIARQLGDEYLLSRAVDFNASVLSNIDAVDSALIGILGVSTAFAVMAVDKIRELGVVSRWIAVGFLAASGVLSMYGYTHGFIGRHTREVPRPAVFVTDFFRYGSKALARAIREAVQRSEENLEIRRRKRMMVLIAIVLLVAGAIVVTYARVNGGNP